VWSRIHLVPMLMAEGDRDLYRRQQAALALEREIMKDVPGWEVGVYVLNEMLIDSGLLSGGKKCI
jgi:NADH dehydrogenase (ubiquinone) 1 alpha subcomplex subunit 13